MSIKTISIAPRETNLYLPNQPAVKHPLGKTLKILACLVDGTKIIKNFEVEKLILDSWASGTRKQYKIYFKQWTTFCKTQPVDISSALIKDGTEFLLSLYKKGLGYSAINTARSMLSKILPVKEGIKFGKHLIVTRMLKGIFRTRPALPRYICIHMLRKL